MNEHWVMYVVFWATALPHQLSCPKTIHRFTLKTNKKLRHEVNSSSARKFGTGKQGCKKQIQDMFEMLKMQIFVKSVDMLVLCIICTEGMMKGVGDVQIVVNTWVCNFAREAIHQLISRPSGRTKLCPNFYKHSFMESKQKASKRNIFMGNIMGPPPRYTKHK